MTETNRIEYKRELTKELDLEKEVIAFLNYHEGGVISIGIDKNGVVVGVADMDSDMLKIKDRLKTNISPSCMGLFDVSADEKEGKNLIKITVASGSEKPYFKRKYGMSEKGCYIRIGTAAEPMPQKMIDELFAKRTRNSIGKIKANRQDLTFNQLKIYYEGAGLPLNNQFAKTLDLQTEEGVYNYVGYLLSDSNSVSIKVAKYAGTDKCDLIENEEYGFCSLIKATNRVLDKFEVENKTFTKITGDAERLQRQMIDKTALREALINAIVHNDYTREVTPVIEIYSDRLSITSYGGLIDGLNLEEFFEGRSMPRNRELMRVFRDLKFVEHLGSGIHRILNKYDKSIFKISENFVEICFPFAEGYEKEQGKNESNSIGGSISGSIGGSIDELTDRQQEIMKLILQNNKISYRSIADKIGIHESAVGKHIETLKTKKIIERVGGTRGYWIVKI